MRAAKYDMAIDFQNVLCGHAAIVEISEVAIADEVGDGLRFGARRIGVAEPGLGDAARVEPRAGDVGDAFRCSSISRGGFVRPQIRFQATRSDPRNARPFLRAMPGPQPRFFRLPAIDVLPATLPN
jgi:hypothetical protein